MSANAPFGDALWMWPENLRWDLHNCYAQFRKIFEISRVPKKALCRITADQSYRLYVNGRYVCGGPARGFQESWPYDAVDISNYLKPGRNLIAIRAYNPGAGNFQYVSRGAAGVIVMAQIGKTRLCSDATWRARREVGVNRQAIPASVQLFCQEHIDLRLESPEWIRIGYDDSSWTDKVAVAGANSLPWVNFEGRGLPMLDENIIRPRKGIGTNSGKCAARFRNCRDVAAIRHSEGLNHTSVVFATDRIRVPATGRGKFRSYLVDFGKTVVGRICFSISGAEGGEIIDTLHTETISQESLTPDFVPHSHSQTAFGTRLICRKGRNSHTFYHPFGFRYVTITIRDSERELLVEPRLRKMLYPLDQKGCFHSSDHTLEKIWNACALTQRICSMDAYVDTPWREQAQWWGDARVQAKNTFFLSGDCRLFRRGISQIARQRTFDGLTYGHAPTVAHHCVLPDFSLIWLITLWDYYWQTGSLEPFLAHKHEVAEVLSYFDTNTGGGQSLIGHDKRYWLFLDWCDLFKDGYSTVYNLWLLIALQKAAKLFRLAREVKSARRLSEWIQRHHTLLGRAVLPDGSLVDGFSFRGTLVESTSIHSQTLAILAGFQPKNDGMRIRRYLLPYVREGVGSEIEPSCYWATYPLEVLTRAGYGYDVVRFIRSKWQSMGQHGTTWEVFKPRVANESFSHAWSAHPLYHLIETIGGVRQSAPAWREIVFDPCFEGKEGNVVVPTPNGEISSGWVKGESTTEVSLSLPPSVSAIVKLPGHKKQSMRGTARWNIANQKIKTLNE